MDGQTNQDDINKAIDKISSSANRESKKESIAKKIIKSFMSEGYYGYMLLRKAIGHKLEHPSLRPCYANEISKIPGLINPGGKITLSEGNFIFSSQVDFTTSNVALVGAGYEATKISGAVDASVEYFHLSGGVENILLSDFYIDGSLHPNNTAYRGCIGSTTSGNIDSVRIERVKIYSSSTGIACIQFENDSGTIDNLSVEDCYLKYVGDKGYAFAKRKPGKNTIIRGNTIIQSNTSGYNACSLYEASENPIVANNILYGDGHSPIAYSPAHHGIIANNIIYGSASGTEEGAIDIECTTGHGPGTTYYIVVSGNTIHPVSSTGLWAITIYAWDACGTPNNMIISNNIIEDYSVGIKLHDGDNILISNNIFKSCTTPIDKGSVTNCRIINNIGYNPVGNFTAPSVPASGSAYTNEYGYPCMVSVYGGTVSAIAIDGVDTGQTYGAFVVAPSETITLTYSSAPTWVWYGL